VFLFFSVSPLHVFLSLPVLWYSLFDLDLVP
jgi:hypothetical protein